MASIKRRGGRRETPAQNQDHQRPYDTHHRARRQGVRVIAVRTDCGYSIVTAFLKNRIGDLSLQAAGIDPETPTKDLGSVEAQALVKHLNEWLEQQDTDRAGRRRR